VKVRAYVLAARRNRHQLRQSRNDFRADRALDVMHAQLPRALITRLAKGSHGDAAPPAAAIQPALSSPKVADDFLARCSHGRLCSF